MTVWNGDPGRLDGYPTAADGRPDALRLALVTGDRIDPDLLRRFAERRSPGRFVALGGAPEAATWSTVREVDAGRADWPAIPAGFPLRNQRYRVAGPAGRDCPDFVAGEPWIGGLGIAEGYRGDPVRTAENFVWRSGRRRYRAGVAGRFWPDGALEHLGLIDQDWLPNRARRDVSGAPLDHSCDHVVDRRIVAGRLPA